MLYANSREEIAEIGGFATSICVDSLNSCREVMVNKRFETIEKQRHHQIYF